MLFLIHSFKFISGDIRLPQRVNEAMQMQVEAERKKRAAILESEGIVAIFNVLITVKEMFALVKPYVYLLENFNS